MNKVNKLISGLTNDKKTFFNNAFYKVSERRYKSKLKHYNENYTITEVVAIIDAQPIDNIMYYLTD